MKYYISCVLIVTCTFINFLGIRSYCNKREIQFLDHRMVDINSSVVDDHLFYSSLKCRNNGVPCIDIQCSWKPNLTEKILPKLNWTKNGKDLMNEFSSGKMYAITNFINFMSNLYIPLPTKEDEGLYKCVPEYNRFFNLTNHALTHYYKNPLDVQYYGTYGLYDVIVGDEITIECRIIVTEENTQNFTITWTKDYKQLPTTNPNYLIETDLNENWSKLTIKHVTHSGHYRCISHRKYYELRVQFRLRNKDPEPEKEYFEQINQSPDAGQRSILAGCFNIKQNYTVRWLRNGKPINELSAGYLQVFNDDTTSRKYSELRVSAHLPPFPSLLNGIYSCLVESPISGEVSLPPLEYIGPQHTHHGLSPDSVFIHCNLKPENGEYQWFKNGVPIRKLPCLFNSKTVSFYKTGLGEMLFLEYFDFLYTGFYKCTRNSKQFYYLRDMRQEEDSMFRDFEL